MFDVQKPTRAATGEAAAGCRPVGPAPRRAALAELARALGAVFLVPFRFIGYVARRRAIRAAVAKDVAEGAAIAQEPAAASLPARPLRIFLSCAEASGEIHGTTLVRELRARAALAGAPAPEIVGFGGERLRALGVATIGDPVARARTNFDGVLRALPYYVGLLEDAGRHMRETRPDVFVPIDSPALHVPLARIARKYGVPTVHFIAPQYWGWAPWRVRGYRQVIDRALTILPHEPAWYARHGVRSAHVGHPLLDALEGVPETCPAQGARTLAILPGSRAGVMRRNLPWMLSVLGPLRAAHPETRIAVLQSTEEHRALLEELTSGADVELSFGDLHAELAKARAAFAVSGTVLTDVLHHWLPAVVLYRFTGRADIWMRDHLLTVPWFSSTNLLAGGEVLPEHCFRGDGPKNEVAAQLLRAYGDPDWRMRSFEGFEEARRRLGPAGATGRAAGHVLEVASEHAERR